MQPKVAVVDPSTLVMCEMAGAADARMLGKRARRLTLDEVRMVEEALELVLATIERDSPSRRRFVSGTWPAQKPARSLPQGQRP